MILRREIKFHEVEAMIYLSRMFLLQQALKLPMSSYLSPVFVATCGLFQSGMQVFKSMRGKKHFHKLTFEDVKAKSKAKLEEEASKEKKQVKVFIPFERGTAPRQRHYSQDAE